jgi:hypothetical protein
MNITLIEPKCGWENIDPVKQSRINLYKNLIFSMGVLVYVSFFTFFVSFILFLWLPALLVVKIMMTSLFMALLMNYIFKFTSRAISMYISILRQHNKIEK